MSTTTKRKYQRPEEIDGILKITEVRPEGEPDVDHLYVKRVLGLTWPSAHNNGYYIMLGQRKERSIIQGKPYIDMLTEGEGTYMRPARGGKVKAKEPMDLTGFFNKMISSCMLFHCKEGYANLDPQTTQLAFELDRFKIQRGIELALFDSSEWGNLETTIFSINKLGLAGLLRLRKNSTIRREQTSMGPDALKTHDGTKPWQRYPAVNALGIAVRSFDIAPYQKSATHQDAPDHYY